MERITYKQRDLFEAVNALPSHKSLEKITAVFEFFLRKKIQEYYQSLKIDLPTEIELEKLINFHFVYGADPSKKEIIKFSLIEANHKRLYDIANPGSEYLFKLKQNDSTMQMKEITDSMNK